MEPKDQKDRLTAAIPADYNVIVEAGAGTGKTTLLINRLCYLILGNDIAIDQIIALTFTEKAAAEIKIRLLAKMQKIIKEIDNPKTEDEAALTLLNHFKKQKEDLRKSVQTSFELAERAQISTIHSFCLQILRKYPLEAALAPKCQADDGAFTQSIFDKKWSAFLEKQLTFESPAQDIWRQLLAVFSLEELKNFAFTLLNPALENYHPFANTEEVKNYCLSCANEAQALSQSYLAAKKRDVETSLEQACAYLTKSAELAGTNNEEVWPDIKMPSSTAPKNWPKEDYARAKELINFANSFMPHKQLLINKAFNLLSGLRQDIKEEIRKENIVSYDELIYKTKELLKHNKAVREELKKEYKSILIDEFQDTDPAQGEMLLFLSESQNSFAQNWDKVILQQGKLFVVGDPKQSIYRFRGADINAYEKFTDLMQNQGAQKCFLKTNFRSLPNIISFANAFGQKAVTEQKGVQPKYIEIEAGRQSAGSKVLISAVKSNEPKTPIDLYRQNQAQFIAAWIKDNVGKTKLADGSLMRLKDIAILVRSTSALDIYTDALKRFDLKFTVEETRNFYTAQEVLDIINILKLLSDPLDKTALLGVLRSPFALLPDAEILKLSQKNQLNIFAEVEDMPRVKQIYKQLKDLHFKAGRLPVEELISEIVYNTDFLMLQTLAAQKEQTIANIFKFVSVVRKMHAQGALNLGQFLFYAQKYSKEQNKEGESPLAEESLDTLSIMTMHKSKGLEFPVVVLADLSRKEVDRTDKKPLYINNWYNGACGIRLGSLPDGNFSLLEQQNKAHAKAEEMRILYVALTRAKEYLMIVGDLKNEEASLAGALQGAGCYPDAEAQPLKLEGREDISSLTYVPCLAAEKLSATNFGQAELEAVPLNLQHWREAWQKRSAAYEQIMSEQSVLTPSAEPQEDDNATIFRGNGDAAITGKICHKMLYDILTFGKTDARKAVAAVGEDIELCENPLKEAQNIIDNFIASPIFKELKSLKFLAAELPFTMLSKEGRTVNGIMDAVFEGKDGEIFIADYKSDNIKEQDIAAKTAFYSAQTDFYKAAAREIFKTNKVSAAVVFLRPARAQKV